MSADAIIIAIYASPRLVGKILMIWALYGRLLNYAEFLAICEVVWEFECSAVRCQHGRLTCDDPSPTLVEPDPVIQVSAVTIDGTTNLGTNNNKSPRIAIIGGYQTDINLDINLNAKTVTTPAWPQPFVGNPPHNVPAMFHDNTLLVCGGSNTKKCFKHELGSSTWKEVAPLSHSHILGNHVVVKRKKLFVMARFDPVISGTETKGTEIYDFEKDEWTVGPDLPIFKGKGFAAEAVSIHEVFYYCWWIIQ